MPRRSPRPSSPTVPVKRMSSSVRIPARFIARSTARTVVIPRPSSPIPGAKSVSPRWVTLTSVPSGKTVSRWPLKIRVSSPIVPSLSPRTFPSASIHTLSTPTSRSIST